MIAELVLPWSHILFGSLIGPAVGVVALWLARERLLATIHRDQPGSRTLKIAGIATLAVLVMDIYTW